MKGLYEKRWRGGYEYKKTKNEDDYEWICIAFQLNAQGAIDTGKCFSFYSCHTLLWSKILIQNIFLLDGNSMKVYGIGSNQVDAVHIILTLG